MKIFAKELENTSTVCSYFLHSNIELLESTIYLASDNLPVLISELLPENLDTFTTHMKGNLSVQQQLDLCGNIANGLQYLHFSGLIHSNLHGRNVLMSYDSHAKIGDYVCSQVALPGEILPYNIPYVPPEAIEDKSQCNELSDVYSLGVLFLQIAMQHIPELTDGTELSKITKRREELAGIEYHPLVPLILRCLTMVRAVRPSVTQVLKCLATVKDSDPSFISYSLYKVGVCFTLHT